jgi:hypothetical protein
VWGPEAERLVANAPERAHEYRDVLPVRGVRTTDLRGEGSLVLQRSLELLPRELPVLGVVIEVTPGERVASAFVAVRGRWVWLWDLERLGGIVARAGDGGGATPSGP